MRSLALSLILGCLCATSCGAQHPASSDSGQVTSPSGPSIPSTGVTNSPNDTTGATGSTGTGTGHPAPRSRNVLTQHNDGQRTGAMLDEVVLNTNNVNSTSFGLLRTLSVEGYVYAQPLYVEGINIGGKIRNVLFIATAHNSVYAFDADDTTDTTPLWEVNLGPSFQIETYTPQTTNLGPEEGIIATPVIDLTSQSMWVTAMFQDPTSTPNVFTYNHKLYRLDLLTGESMAPGPVVITASAPGSGFESVDNMVGFTEPTMLQRTSLLLANGQIYMGFAGAGVTAAYHGWFLSYDANTLQQTGAFTTSPNSSSSGIWQGGQGPAVDANGFVYVTSGDGNNSNAATERVESLMKFEQAAGGLVLADYFTPAAWQQFDIDDLDFGSTGVVLVPGLNMSINGDKSGNLYFANTANLGQLGTDDSALYQKIAAEPNTGYFGSAVYYAGPKGPRVYAWARGSVMKAWDVSTTAVPSTPADETPANTVTYLPGAMLSVSANGSTAGTGIVWATTALADAGGYPAQAGELLAYDASDLSRLLYSSQTNGTQDSPGTFGKFNPPTIANGKVIVGTFSNKVAVYGLK